ncbi:MAG: helix-turn-helix domain-containing protein [Candidatus Aquirickettsiella gammari]
MSRDQEYLKSLAHELISLPAETGWLEFKHNNAEPQEIGEYISALSNSAVSEGKSQSYLIWGVDDNNHSVIGTDFDPQTKKIGNEELESWLLRQLSPKISFHFHHVYRTVSGSLS